MKMFILLPLLIIASLPIFSQEKHLLGIQSPESFAQPPYNEWFTKGHNTYQPNESLITTLQNLTKKNISFKVFFGSWCGDTKRELPKFLKLLNQIGVSQKQIQLIGVDNSTDTYKQSPQREEVGWNVYRVPTFIVLEKDREIGRIVEYPAFSFERDLLMILQKQNYQPNYKGYPIVSQWLNDGLLSDPNINIRGLANQVRGIIHQDSELNALGYVLLGQKRMKEAIAVLQVNSQLFPTVANCFDSLAEAYLLNNQKDFALAYYEYALKLAPDNKSIQQSVDKLKSAK